MTLRPSVISEAEDVIQGVRESLNDAVSKPTGLEGMAKVKASVMKVNREVQDELDFDAPPNVFALLRGFTENTRAALKDMSERSGGTVNIESTVGLVHQLVAQLKGAEKVAAHVVNMESTRSGPIGADIGWLISTTNQVKHLFKSLVEAFA